MAKAKKQAKKVKKGPTTMARVSWAANAYLKRHAKRGKTTVPKLVDIILSNFIK